MRFFIAFLSVFLFANVNIDIKTKTVDMDYKSTLFVENYNVPRKKGRIDMLKYIQNVQRIKN